jgi:hypothetical protein
VSCRTGHKGGSYSSVSWTSYLAEEPALLHQPLLISGIKSDAAFEAVLARYTSLEVALLGQQADLMAAELRSFVAESQYDLRAEWPQEIFKPSLSKFSFSSVDRYWS